MRRLDERTLTPQGGPTHPTELFPNMIVLASIGSKIQRIQEIKDWLTKRFPWRPKKRAI